MTPEAKIISGISILTLALLLSAVFFLSSSEELSQKALLNPSALTKPSNNKISSTSATVTIIEFADFQCPACAAVHPTLKQILTDYTGKVTFVYRHFPLPQHANAIPAAKAAEAAGEQGKFWEMYDLLYQKQQEWSESTTPNDFFITYAKTLQIDLDTFTQDMLSTKYNQSIEQDTSDGRTLSVNSTPTLFVNNKKLEEFPTYQILKDIIEEELKK